MKYILTLFMTIFLLPLPTIADTIILKNGRQIQTDKVWEEKGLIKFTLHGAVIGYNKDSVETVIRNSEPSVHAIVSENKITKKIGKPPVKRFPVLNNNQSRVIVSKKAVLEKPLRLKVMSIVPQISIFIVIIAFLAMMKIFLKGIWRKKKDSKDRSEPEKRIVEEENQIPVIEFPYRKISCLFTPAEKSFLHVLDQAVGDKYRIFGKVRLADVISVKNKLSGSDHQSALNRINRKHIDFVLCHPADLSLLCAIELDDRSHRLAKRKERDDFVDGALKAANVPIVHYPAKAGYVVQDIRDKLSEVLDGESAGPGNSRLEDSSKPAFEKIEISFSQADEINLEMDGHQKWEPPGF